MSNIWSCVTILTYLHSVLSGLRDLEWCHYEENNFISSLTNMNCHGVALLTWAFTTRLITCTVNWLPAWSTDYLHGHLITCMVNWLPAQSTSYLHGQLITCMVIWLPAWSTDCLHGQLVTCMVNWLPDQLIK